MLITSSFSCTTRRCTSRLVRHTQTALASLNAGSERNVPKYNALRNPLILSSHKVTKDLITQVKRFLQKELHLQHIEGFIHKCLDKALLSTPRHQKVYEAVIVYLIQNMWPQPAASVYDRMLKKGFISSDIVDAGMLIVLLADSEDSTDPVLRRISDIVSNPNFSDQHFLFVLNMAEDYNVRPKFIVALIQDFLRGKGTKYTPCSGVIAVWLRAAVKLGDVGLMKEILELGDATLKLSAIAEAWEVADKLDNCLEKLGLRLVGAVANPATQEDEFLRAVKVIEEVGLNEQIVARVCSSFLANRDSSHVLKTETVRAAIVAFIRADNVGEAFALLNRVGIQPGKRPLYRTFLANLRHCRPLDHHSFAKLLSAIDAAGIPLDTSLLNIIISREVRLKRAANALSMYNEMKGNPHLPPDSHTFGSLFAMYRRIRPSSLRRFSSAKSATTPRELFHELMLTCKHNHNPVRPSTSLLNCALRAFMRQRDYVGAIVVIRSFSFFRVPLDHKSYYHVVKLLVRRVWAEVQGSRPKHEGRWVDRFLGVQHYADIVLGNPLVHEIFTALCRKDFDISLPLHVRHQGRRHRMRHLRQRTDKEEAYYTFPTMEMMESLAQPEPADFIYDPVPLIRLLSRAVHAEAVVCPKDAAWRIDQLIKGAENDMALDSS